MSAAPLAPLSSPESQPLVTQRGLDLTGKIIPLLATGFSFLALMGGGYSAYTARQASIDTLIVERSARNVETRAVVEDFKTRLPILETKEATNERDIAELKKDITEIKGDIKTLLQRTPPK